MTLKLAGGLEISNSRKRVAAKETFVARSL
jgi:hypothetical protein